MFTRTAVFALGLLLFTSGPAPAQMFEAPHAVPVSRILPADERGGEGFALADDAYADGFSQRFTIGTEKFGELEATSEYMLSVRLLEVRALEALDRLSTTKEFGKAVARAGAAPAFLVKDLATRPVETVTAIPKGLYKGGKRAVTWLAGDRRQRAETEDGATKEAIGFSRRKRALARRLHVDPFTSNVRLQDELDRVAWATYSGGMTLAVAFAAVGVPPVIGITYRTARLQNTTNEMVTSMSGGDLHRRNRGILREMGMDPDEVERFLDNPHLSPYHKTAITLALNDMEGVAGRKRVIEVGIDVGHYEKAERLQRTAQLARGYHANVEPVESIVRQGDTVLLRTKSKKLVATLPADRLLWTQWTSDLGTAMKKWKAGDGEEGWLGGFFETPDREIWISGVFSERARSGLEELGLALNEQAGDRLEADLAAQPKTDEAAGEGR